MAVHWYCRCLADYLCLHILKWLNVIQLRACGRNWFRTVATTKEKLVRVVCIVFCNMDDELQNVVAAAYRWTVGN